MRTDNVGVLASAVLALVAVQSTARADAVGDLGKKLATLASKTETLRQGIKRPSDADRAVQDRAERRLIDGQVAFGVGNFDDAALLLYDYVERYPNSPSHDEALYYLAESLFQKRDNMAARTFFTRLVTESGGKSKFYQQSLERLVELALKLDDRTDVDRWLQALEQLPPAQRRASVPYVRGKYAYFQNNYSEAIQRFAAVSPDGEYYFQARYFMGASYIALNDLGKAAQEYAQLIQLQAKTDEDSRVIELSHMALGRLYYERDQPSKAIDEYTRIARTSDLFDEALYEVAWVYVKSQQFDKALRALELLALADPSSAKQPEVRILEGNLRIRKAQGLQGKDSGNSAEEYEKAQTAFETTREAFEKPHAELAKLAAERADPRQFMAQITGRVTTTFEVRSTLPEVAVAWLREEPEVQRVIGIESDLGEIAEDIAEAEHTIERLEQALSSPARVEIFPPLAEKHKRATEILEEIMTIRHALADEEQVLAARYATPEQKAELARLGSRRRARRAQLESMPDARVGYSERIERARAQYVALDQRAAEVATIIDTTRATLTALDKFVQDEVAAGRSLPVRDEAETTMADLRAEVWSLEQELAGIRREIVLAKDEAGTGDEPTIRARTLRAELRAALAEEHQAASRALQGTQGRDRARGVEIGRLMASSDDTIRKLDQIHITVDEIVDFALADIRSSLADEKVRLSAHKREFVAYEAESQELGADILRASFRAVKDKLYHVLVRSEIGIIDVAWSQKEAIDEESRRLDLDKQREVRTLREEFRDVLEERQGGER